MSVFHPVCIRRDHCSRRFPSYGQLDEGEYTFEVATDSK